jgi:hypothetical protein
VLSRRANQQEERKSMKWLEMIKVQTASGQERGAEEELAAFVREILNDPGSSGLLETVLYQHASVPGCFAVQLTWDREAPGLQGSVLGLRLTQTVKSFGLVNHSVWIEKE